MKLVSGKQLLQALGVWEEPTEAKDFESLRTAMLGVPHRFSDLADLLEKAGHHQHVPFMRASAERYRKVLGLTG